MSKNLLFLIAFLSCAWSFSQQNNEFREVKEFYDYQRSLLIDAFKKEASQPRNLANLPKIEEDYYQFMQKMDSLQNVALLGALIRVRNREDLGYTKTPVKSHADARIDRRDQEESPAEYPGGMDLLRQQVARVFYFDALLPEKLNLSADIYFVVEKDGSISSVKANGNNTVFNRQAEIAVYLLPERFKPATLDGMAVRYSFRVPLSMKLD